MPDKSSQNSPLKLRTPHLLFLADVESEPYAKTAFGVRDWAPQASLAQWRLPGCAVDLGLPEMTPEAAAAAGAGSLLIGTAAPGGGIPQSWEPLLLRAVEAGLDIVSGTHDRLENIAGLAAAARRHRVSLIDVRHSTQTFPVASGRYRPGKRLLTVGTDCVVGKKYTALALAKALRTQGIDADFRATGQTGIMIAGSGVAIDAVVADFIAGAAERLSPDAAPDHWDVIEGQGSLFHPSYAGVTLGLVHGSRPDVLILCHDPSRTDIESCDGYPLPALEVAAERYLEAARLTNMNVRLSGVSLNTSKLGTTARAEVIAATEESMRVPCFDPMRSSLDAVLESILSL